MKMEFFVAEWAKEYELSEETIGSLDKKGFNSKRSMSKLTKEIIKCEFKGLKAAQILLLEDAINILRDPQLAPVNMETVAPAASNPAIGTEQKKLDAGNSLDVNDILAILGSLHQQTNMPKPPVSLLCSIH